MINKHIINQLIDSAREASENAFVITHTHRFGAALLTTDGDIFTGCNVESSISGLGSCAERVAINNAVTHGHYKFDTLLVYNKDLTYPCGACLQYLAQFDILTKDSINIIVTSSKGETKKTTLEKILPKAYKTDNPRTLELLKRYQD